MKTVFALLCAAVLLTTGADALELSAPSAVLMERDTGTILYAQDEHTQREPASVTKIMTLLLTMEAIDSGALDYDDVITASAHASSMGGSQIWLEEGEQMTVSICSRRCAWSPPTTVPWPWPNRSPAPRRPLWRR